MKKRLVFEYDDAVELPQSLSAVFISRKTDNLFRRNGRIEDAEPEKLEHAYSNCYDESTGRAFGFRRCIYCGVGMETETAENPEPLKPCPFCGGEALSEHGVSSPPLWWVKCNVCRWATPLAYKSEQEARAAWNRRASAA